MSATKKGKFVFYASENGRDGWMLVKPADVPKWITDDPEVLGHIVNGMVAMKCDEGEKGSLHYRAEVALGAQDAARRDEALAARANREAGRLLIRQPSKNAFVAHQQSKRKH